MNVLRPKFQFDPKWKWDGPAAISSLTNVASDLMLQALDIANMEMNEKLRELVSIRILGQIGYDELDVMISSQRLVKQEYIGSKSVTIYLDDQPLVTFIEPELTIDGMNIVCRWYYQTPEGIYDSRLSKDQIRRREDCIQ